MKRMGWCAIVLCLVLAVRAGAEQPAGKFQVHDLSLWVLDNAGSTANVRTAYPSAFPATIHSARTAAPVAAAGGEAVVGLVVNGGAATLNVAGGGGAPAAPPSAPPSGAGRRVAPFGWITFLGEAATNVDIDLRVKSGSFLAHWPPAESLPNRLRWAGGPQVDLLATLADESQLMLVDDEHWFRKAREIQNLFVRRGVRAERFLAYDAELNLPAPVKLEGGPDKFTITNTSGATLRDVLILRNSPQGRRIAWIDELPPQAQPPAAAKAAAAKPGARPPVDLFGDGKDPKVAAEPKTATAGEDKATDKSKAEAPGGGAKAAAAAATLVNSGFFSKAQADALVAQAAAKAVSGATAAAEPPALSKGVEVTLSEPLEPGSEQAVAQTTAQWTDRIARAGVTRDEAALVVAHAAPLVFESEALVVACRLDPSTIEDKMPLSIFPEPTKIVRVPLVVMRNADPQLAGQIEQLVVELGNPKFKSREAAAARLVELGPLAFPALNKALNHTDLEIVIRAERILLNQNQQANGRQGATGGPSMPAAPAAQAAPVLPRVAAPAAPAAAAK